MEKEEINNVIRQLREEHTEILIELIDRTCVGCTFVALSDAVMDRTESVELAEEVRDLARGFSGRGDYCGDCKAELWDIRRDQADGLSIPWETHKPRKV